MKPYKIPAPRIWVTDQVPIFYAGRIIRIKPSVIFEEKSDNSTNEIKTTDMDQNKRIEMLLKRLEDLSNQCLSRGIIIEDSAQYGNNRERHLEMEIQRMELALIEPVQILWEKGLGQEQ